MFVVNAAQANDVLFGPPGCAAKLPKGAVVLCCTTVAPDAARRAGGQAGRTRAADAGRPGLGRRGRGGGGTMTVMGSGAPEAFDLADPVLEAIATKVWRLGDAAGSAAR